MNNPFHFLSAMLLRGAISAFCALLCASCATEKWGVYEVLHRERFQDDYEAILLKSDDSVRFKVEHRFGQVWLPICEVEVDPEQTRAVVTPYRSGHLSDDVTVFYREGKITSVNFMTQGEDTVVLFDLDGDGYPERRATLGPDPSGMLEEELVPQVVSSRRPFPKTKHPRPSPHPLKRRAKPPPRPSPRSNRDCLPPALPFLFPPAPLAREGAAGWRISDGGRGEGFGRGTLEGRRGASAPKS